MDRPSGCLDHMSGTGDIENVGDQDIVKNSSGNSWRTDVFRFMTYTTQSFCTHVRHT